MAHLLGMFTKRRVALFALAPSALAALVPFAACSPTSHLASPASLGGARPSPDLEAVVDEPSPVRLETVVAADWEVARSGLINLEHPTAKKAGLEDGPEPIVIVFHAIRHPTAGLFLVDTGVERALRDDPAHAALHGVVARYAGVEKIRVRTDTASWLAKQDEPVKGVFLTHLHMDHVSGMRDVPNDAQVYTGPNEASEKSFLHLFVRSVTDAALEGKGVLREWTFAPDPGGAFEGVLDVFGDRTVWAIHVPGHTAGSTAYLVRTPRGPVLLTGDASHTLWGWRNGVEPGTFSSDRPQSAKSLARLRAFVEKHPKVEVRLGHQLDQALLVAE
jgi:N-acyl homoserine lactone hydrolase